MHEKNIRVIVRYDSNTTVACSLNRYVQLFAGFKYNALYYFWQANNPQGFLDYYGRLDHSYGGTFSFIYSFDGKKTAG